MMPSKDDFIQCDNCGRWLEPDEELESIYIGDKTDYVRPHSSTKQIVDRDGPGSAVPRLLGKEPGELKALLRALFENPHVEYDTYSRVMEHSGEMLSFDESRSMHPSTEVELDEDKCAAEVLIEFPQSGPRDPDLEVCETCLHEFGGYEDD
jgi:hypothetical protein